jgi:hypothetical protein
MSINKYPKHDWVYINPEQINPEAFGLEEIFAVKVKPHTEDYDIRCVSYPGWKTKAELAEKDPRDGRPLKNLQWFIFAAQGPEKVLAS